MKEKTESHGEEIIFGGGLCSVGPKAASAVWLAANEAPLREIGGRLAGISERTRDQEIAGRSGVI